MKNTRSVLWYALTLLALGLVFLMYTRPEFMMDVANQIWACF